MVIAQHLFNNLDKFPAGNYPELYPGGFWKMGNMLFKDQGVLPDSHRHYFFGRK